MLISVVLDYNQICILEYPINNYAEPEMRRVEHNKADRKTDHKRMTEHALEKRRLERLENDPRAVHAEEYEDPNIWQKD